MSKHTKTALVISAILMILIVIKLYQSIKNDNPETQILQQKIEIQENDIIFGSDKAPLTMFVFSDYNCKYCKRFFNEVLPKIQKQYIETGKLKLVLKLVVLRESPEWMEASQAVMCANQVSGFEEMHKLLVFNSKVVFTENFQTLMDDIIADNPDMAKCLLQHNDYKYIKQNNADFRNNNMQGTPTFVIGNEMYPGYRSFEKFEVIFHNSLSNNRSLDF
ncbi:MAG: DsbA family protein [Bacteroidota bacterium]